MDWLVGFYNYRVVASYLPAFMAGLGVTFAISAVALTLALSLGIPLAAARLYGSRRLALALASAAYVEAIRATPLLVQLYLLYFAIGPLPGVGRLNELQAGTLALGLNGAAYFSEIIRAGVAAVAKGQLEAGRGLGLSFWQCLRLVVLPQAARNALPPLIGQTAMLIKDSSVVSFIGVIELTAVGIGLMSDRLLPNEGFLTAAAGYLLIYLVALACARHLDKARSDLGPASLHSTRRRRW